MQLPSTVDMKASLYLDPFTSAASLKARIDLTSSRLSCSSAAAAFSSTLSEVLQPGIGISMMAFQLDSSNLLVPPMILSSINGSQTALVALTV